VRVAIAVERDLDPLEAKRQQPIHDLFGQQEAVGDHRHDLRQPALRRGEPEPLGQVVEDRQVEERLPAKERQHELLGPHAIHLAFDPDRKTLGGLERHLLGKLVVVVAVALVAVVAREVALQGRQDGDIQFRAVALHAREVVVERRPIVIAARDQEPVLS
jgi:hypothetical protein